MLLRAWAIRKTYDVAISLGQLELALNQARDAAEHLDFALRNFPPQQSADMLRQVRSDFARAESQVGTLSVNVSHPGARVPVDGTLVGTAPLLAPIFLTVGSHTISADLDGSQAEKTVVAKASITTSLSLELLRPQSPPAETAYPQQSAAPSRVPVFVGGAVVVVGVGLGVGFALAAGSKTRQSDSLRESIEPGTCYVGGESRCGQLRDTVEAHDRYRDFSTSGFVLAGAALAGTLLYWTVTESSSSHQVARGSRIRLGAAATSQNAALWVGGAF
jgi:hypothetical protein